MPTQQTVDLLTPLLELLAELEIDPAQLLTLPEFKEYLPPNDKVLSEHDEMVLLQILADLTQRSDLPLRLGQHIKLTNFGTLSFAFMSCVNLHEVIKLMIRYHPIINRGPAWQLNELNPHYVLRAQPTLNTPALHRSLMEVSFSAICTMGELLLNRPINQIALHLNYPAPAYADYYDKLFSMPVQFGQTHCQLLIDEQDLHTPLRTANPAGHMLFLQQCDELLRDLNRVDNFSATVRRLLISAGGKFPDIKHIAKRLNVSERTLRRRLTQESSSFRIICDEVRNVLACQYLANTQLTVAEVAYLLHYTETVSFRRAFVRWNGITPSQYRGLGLGH